MKGISLVIDNFFLNNKLFDLNNKIINWDHINYNMIVLRNKLESLGFELNTYDITQPQLVTRVLYFNYQNIDAQIIKNNSYLLMLEPVIVQPELYDTNYHANFKKIFTFCDKLVDNKKYYKINHSCNIPKVIPKDITIKCKLCTLIAGNKNSNHKLELYSKRIEAIRWFEANHLDDFDLYGRGFDQYLFSNTLFGNAYRKIYKRLPQLIKNLFGSIGAPFSSYKGTLEEKIPVLKYYKFAICYENARDISGYITEKIFHCFFAGCVPIYWGADNITNYIPKECFIDKRNFNSYKELYIFIINMSDNDYLSYLNAIEEYLNSEQAQQFSVNTFATAVIDEILN